MKVFPESGVAKKNGQFAKEPKGKSSRGRPSLCSSPSYLFFFFFLPTEPPDYQGARTARAIVDGSLAELPNFSVKVVGGQSTGKAKNVDEFLASNPTLPKALLFTTKSSTAPLFKALSVDFNNR